MANTIDLLSVVGTWVAAAVALITLVALVPLYLLYRESQNKWYEALSRIDDKRHDYLSKGYNLLPGRRFFRSIHVPDLTEPPHLPTVHENPALNKRDTDIFTSKGVWSSTGWVNFVNILRAYWIAPAQRGTLKVVDNEALMPVHRAWLLLIGLVDRYSRREDSGLFVNEQTDPEWTTFGDKAVYGLSGVLELLPSPRNTVCFRLHSPDHMMKMSTHFSDGDMDPRDLLFLYLGYLPAPGGSLYCSGVPSNSTEAGPHFYSSRGALDSFYRLETVEETDIPLYDSRLADEVGVKLSNIRRVSFYRSLGENQRLRITGRDEAGYLDGMQWHSLGYVTHKNTRHAIWLRPSDAHSLALAVLELDISSQSFLCGSRIKDLVTRLLPSDMKNYIDNVCGEGIDTLHLQNDDMELLKDSLREVTERPRGSRGLASSLAWSRIVIRYLIRKYGMPADAMQAIGVLYLTKDSFRDRMDSAFDRRNMSAEVTIDKSKKLVHVPAIGDSRDADFFLDFLTVVSATADSKSQKKRLSPDQLSLRFPQSGLACVQACLAWLAWQETFQAAPLLALYNGLDRITHIATRDLPPREETMDQQMNKVVDACREMTDLFKEYLAAENRSKRNGRRGYPPIPEFA
ncbi:hypothetical protein FOBRF1_006622 [Fusarium oxysporum]